jgi:uncharacterized membrane protein
MTAERGFSVGSAIKYGWRVARANVWRFVPMLLVILAVTGAGQLFETMARERFPFNLLASLITMAVSLAVSLGVIRVSLAFLDEGTAGLKDLVPPVALIPPYFLATLLYILMVCGGLLLGIIPGILWGVRCSLYPYLIVDSKVGAMDSLRGSARLTKGARWDLFSLSLLEGIVNILGFLCLLVGLFLTVPTGWLAKARAYRTLLAQSEAPSEVPAVAPQPAAQDEDPPTAS